MHREIGTASQVLGSESAYFGIGLQWGWWATAVQPNSQFARSRGALPRSAAFDDALQRCELNGVNGKTPPQLHGHPVSDVGAPIGLIWWLPA